MAERRLQLILLMLVITTHTVEAQQVTPADAGALVHYAYAPLLGTGWYRIGDQSAFVFSIPAAYELREPTAEKIGIRLH